MNTNTEKTLQNFSKAYAGFHPVVRKEIYSKIIAWTEWSKLTFYNKKNGVRPLRPLEHGIVEQIFLDYGVCAWTGEEVTEPINL
jgi:hypothetical protein